MTQKRFIILSLTWGLPMTLCGMAAALVLIARGHLPHRWGDCLYFTVGQTNWGGLSLGPVFLTDQAEHPHTLNHEHGHAIQNCLLGPLMPLLTLLSAARYHYHIRLERQGITPPPYESWRFEAAASRLGAAYTGARED